MIDEQRLIAVRIPDKLYGWANLDNALDGSRAIFRTWSKFSTHQQCAAVRWKSGLRLSQRFGGQDQQEEVYGCSGG